MKMRTRWITRHPLQAKYLFIVLLAILLPTILFGVCFYRVVFNLLAEQMAFPEAITANLIPVIRQVKILIFVFLPIIFVVILLLAIAVSHELVGPIQRLEKDLDRILAGNKKHRTRLRETDDLANVSSKINKILDKFM